MSAIAQKKFNNKSGRSTFLAPIKEEYHIMERMQFYPTKKLRDTLRAESARQGISVSQLIIDILSEHCGLAKSKSEKKPLAELTEKILQEVKLFVMNSQPGTTFDLLTASETFSKIEMFACGKPSTNRATIGKIFVSKLGKGEFANVSVVSGKKSVNRATLYEIKKD